MIEIRVFFGKLKKADKNINTNNIKFIVLSVEIIYLLLKNNESIFLNGPKIFLIILPIKKAIKTISFDIVATTIFARVKKNDNFSLHQKSVFPRCAPDQVTSRTDAAAQNKK